VTEGSVPDYNFVMAGGNGTNLTSSKTSNPATYSVPAGGVGTETVATFTNAVNTAQFDLCKLATDPILDGTTFTFDSSYTVNGVTTSNSVQLMPNQCSNMSPPIPVINADGSAVDVQVTEEANASAQVHSIVVSGSGALISNNLATGTSSFNLGTTDGGVTTDMYINEPVLADIPLGGGVSSRGDRLRSVDKTGFSKSSTNLVEELVRQGFEVSSRSVLRLLHKLGYSLQANVKVAWPHL
jgi:hypothetical protein